ncbi:hypothetical protein MYX76_12845 [Desulfobacterota bacterium AH_259_B03_O07]|nr:hypothetical protein [Desulfobacterota bacterium AH_259_B03_O07]
MIIWEDAAMGPVSSCLTPSVTGAQRSAAELGVRVDAVVRLNTRLVRLLLQ